MIKGFGTNIILVGSPDEENIFRQQLAKLLGRPPTQRFRTNGVLIGDAKPLAKSNSSVQ